MFSSNAQTLVNTVNCVGVMGKGVALEAKKRFPDMFSDYVKRCNADEVQLGKPYLFRRLMLPWVLNFPTKDHWRSVSRVKDIEAGLLHLEKHYKKWGIKSLAVPPLGCGHGQLEWRVIGPILYKSFKLFQIPVELYAPFETPLEELKPDFLESTRRQIKNVHPPSYHITPGIFTLVEILNRIEKEPYHWPVGRTTFQKIAYFATESGIPTGLHYQRGSFGPYAAELKRGITALVNNGLIREEKLGRMFAVHVGRTFTDSRKAYRDDINRWEPSIEQISDLFMRMNTRQAEVAATVHFSANELRTESTDEVDENSIFESVMQWKQKRRPPLNPEEVASTIRNLNILGWINAKVSKNIPLPRSEALMMDN